jgi:hypothetical protein
LQRIDYQKDWTFPWAHYRPIFEFAKKYHVSAVALNSEGQLMARDKHAATILSKQLKKGLPIIVLFGGFHVVHNKLPKKVGEKNYLIVHQNMDEVYFKLREMNETAVVVRFNDNEFVLTTSAPWIKYESQAYWYENLMEHTTMNLQIPQVKSLQGSSLENFVFIGLQIINQLNLSLLKKDIENFNLYDFNNIDFLMHHISSYSKSIYNNCYNQVKNNRHFKLPFSSVYYCPIYSASRLSFLVGWHIFDVYRKQHDHYYEKRLFKGRVDIFLYYCYALSFAYLSSKLANPYLKCNMYQDFVASDDLIILKILDENNINHLAGKSIYTIYESARKIGPFLGELIYQHLLHLWPQLRGDLLDYDINLPNFWQLKEKILDWSDYKNSKKNIF